MSRGPHPGTDLPRLNLEPPPDLAIREDGGGARILDPVRHVWVTLTPEEWVRQHVLHFLSEGLGVPRSLLAVERELVWEATRRRADVVVFRRDGRPWMVVECKAPSVPVAQSALDQAGRYGAAIGATYVLVTNGLEMVGWEAIPGGGFRVMQELPGPFPP